MVETIRLLECGKVQVESVFNSKEVEDPKQIVVSEVWKTCNQAMKCLEFCVCGTCAITSAMALAPYFPFCCGRWMAHGILENETHSHSVTALAVASIPKALHVLSTCNVDPIDLQMAVIHV